MIERPPALTMLERLEPNLIAGTADGGRIALNIVEFTRLLRAAGLRVGPDRAVLATEAVLAAGIQSPGVLYWTLHAALVSRPEQREIFDQAFYLFWKDPRFLENMLSVMLPSLKGVPGEDEAALSRRLAEALLPGRPRPNEASGDDLELDMSDSWSAAEVLRERDFEQMTADEQRRAREAIKRMRLVLEERPTRRFGPGRTRDRIDLRQTLRRMGEKGSDYLILAHRARRRRRPPLVVLCDISGSMDAYSRMLLHFVHALTNARDRVHVMLFGTRLTNITRALRGRDPDRAVAKVAADVKDWSGGTRIGVSLAAFNRLWGRRVLGQGAVVLLITDGLDREGGEGIGLAARRLAASCRRLVWLNPLMRYGGYEPIATGARELKPHVSEMRPCHNLASLEDLARALG
jgi:hypothetical protein